MHEPIREMRKSLYTTNFWGFRNISPIDRAVHSGPCRRAVLTVLVEGPRSYGPCDRRLAKGRSSLAEPRALNQKDTASRASSHPLGPGKGSI